eukprot:TRINITY_DN8948_c0_g1_i1.p1 TRINITY_DN8948_c0_g1~~TRINITY_DN8948_c0_g1_i1.p1  ORF type:complete len:164 (+),score=53.64 TRINITY_DN8948_c0_g1_i1:563-1054(+)
MDPSQKTPSTQDSLGPEELAQRRQQEQKILKEKLQEEDSIREKKLQTDMVELFDHLGAYLKGELLATSDDYKLLEQMNQVAKSKYEDMTTMAATLVRHMQELQDKYQKYQPYLAKIDEVESSLTELEKTCLLLDEYTLKLENKFKYLKEAKRLPYKKPPLQSL